MSNTALAQRIFEVARQLPDAKANEALDFILFLRARQAGLEHRDLQNAQQTAMNHVWDNEEDEAWNDA